MENLLTHVFTDVIRLGGHARINWTRLLLILRRLGGCDSGSVRPFQRYRPQAVRDGHPALSIAFFAHTVSVWIARRRWVVLYKTVKVEALRVAEIGIRDGRCVIRPVRRHEPSHGGSVVARAELIEVGFRIAFFAVELVVV